MRRASLTDDELDRIAELRERGKSETTSARRIGCSKGSVIGRLRTLARRQARQEAQAAQ
ncbi:MAG: hypothetical protein WA047_20415 [Phenylobacterium sp.]|uniref:hypothetical protein n=1 Tax=Phenylobacterium sp. TaxID=1871053 RepID=UPI003BB624C3